MRLASGDLLAVSPPISHQWPIPLGTRHLLPKRFWLQFRLPRCSPPASPAARSRMLSARLDRRFAPATAGPFHRFAVLRSFRRFAAPRASPFMELLIVVGIIATLLVLMAPAFTYIKGGTDVTSAAYTIKGVLDTARTYAKANNTYTWVGFYEERTSQPHHESGQPEVGRVIMSIVASKDGTDLGTSTNPSEYIDPRTYSRRWKCGRY